MPNTTGFAPAKTVITVSNGVSVPASEYKRISGQSPELQVAITRMLDAAQAFEASYTKDPKVRVEYRQRIRAAADEIMDKVKSGELTPHEGAQQANAIRNQLLKIMRSRSTAVGRSIAEKLKPEGKGLGELQQKVAHQDYAKPFGELTEGQRNDVWAKIVDSAGRTNKDVNIRVRLYGMAGKTLLIASLAIAVYDVYTAKDKEREAAKDAAGIGSAILAGAAVTAGLGLVTVGAPVVILSVFVAGVLASTAANELFDYFWPEH